MRRRIKVGIFMILYSIGILLALDFIYSNLILHENDRPAGIRNARYSHDLAANYRGHDRWGPLYYPLYTNNLGFKDGMVRNVPAKSDVHRVLLIGDSFTEGVGMSFEDSFAGLLYWAGRAHAEKIEFLNAGVTLYSPVIYFHKIKFLLESGLKFDEVIVFLDISDIAEEATKYFCIDDDPQYKRYCDVDDALDANRALDATERLKGWIRQNLVVLYRTRLMIRRQIEQWRGDDFNAKGVLALDSPENAESSWTFSGSTTSYPPLGLEGGIARALKNMQALADLLAEHGIPMTIVVYPWPVQLAHDDRDSRHAAIWRKFCVKNCKAFINLFPAFFAAKDAHADWYELFFINGDVHFSAKGHALVFRELSKNLF
jgi:lysophospholipase L1-like esterase